MSITTALLIVAGVYLGLTVLDHDSDRSNINIIRSANAADETQEDRKHMKPNHLAGESSPYLLQHAYNPVSWYPWCDEAFAKAKAEDKPIFLSVGYSTCHWCHVMEHESFEDEEVAAILNELFVAIKVDREERPDIDEQYMVATQLMTRHGGWPNSVWLMPDGRPWFAGTYFPKEDRFGRPGFITLLKHLAEVWETRRNDVEAQADQLSEAIRATQSVGDAANVEVDENMVDRAILSFRNSFDAKHGGFGGAPKFPPHGTLALLIDQYRRTNDKQLLQMVTKTLDEMAIGGIHDHIGGGFHRYATDGRWFLPHFEKMLYDNGQMARLYVDAYLITKNEDYRSVAEGIFEWVDREMTDKAGGFYSALDADSEGEEGKCYLWSAAEITEILGQADGEMFQRIYGFVDGGNYHEEATGQRPGTNIAYLPKSMSEVEQAENVDGVELRKRLSNMRAKLLAVRVKRFPPHLDDKVLTSWNGLMISGLAYAGKQLNNRVYIDRAAKAADFILKNMLHDGKLLRTWRKGQAKIAGYLEDYAIFAESLLDLYDATEDSKWRDAAIELVDYTMEHFRDHEAGGFFFTSHEHEKLLLRSKDATDNQVPSGNGVMANVLLRIGSLTDGPDKYDLAAKECFETFATTVNQYPRGATSLLLAMNEWFERADSTPARNANADAGSVRKPVSVDAYLSTMSVRPGTDIQIALQVTVDEGWHIYANEADPETVIPTELKLSENQSMTLTNIKYPKGTSLTSPVFDKPLAVYEGVIRITAALNIDGAASEGEIDVELNLRVQACDDKRCLEPANHVLSIPVTITQTADANQSRHLDVFTRLKD